jgi:hypothetical protein
LCAPEEIVEKKFASLVVRFWRQRQLVKKLSRGGPRHRLGAARRKLFELGMEIIFAGLYE